MSTESPPASSIVLSTAVIDQIVRRARNLYSLPVVAVEVIQLTSNPTVDVRALKECIEKDPALTVKILRVVNSSLFGLSREVSDLNQALALLGTKPLKLLVLGFSLPENLFVNVARQQLDWYWTTTLTRAVAAREISEQLWHRPGDDAFLAGLLEDIGVLALLRELKEPYAQFLAHAVDQRIDLRRLESDALGFDHTALSAALLEHWNMPELLVQSIAELHDYKLLAHQTSPHAELAQILHLARLLAELIGEKRLCVLPELMEAGDAYCGLNKDHLTMLILSLQPKVQQLADVLSLDLPLDTNYEQILIEAHERMSQIAESVAEPLSRPHASDDELAEGLLADAAHLRTAIDKFLRLDMSKADQEVFCEVSQSPLEFHQESGSEAIPPPCEQNDFVIPTSFIDQLTLTVGQCRSRRRGLSVLMLEVYDRSIGNTLSEHLLAHVLDAACRTADVDDLILESCTPYRRALILPNCDRQEAVRHAHDILNHVEQALDRLRASGSSLAGVVSAGVASVGLPSKNFPPSTLIETAQRCLTAAQSGGTNVVKSLEV